MTDDARSEGAAESGGAPLPPFFAERREAPSPGASASPAPPFFSAEEAAAAERVSAAAGAAETDGFPDDIFFVPEGAAAPVSGEAGEPVSRRLAGESAAADTQAVALAARLETLAGRLRREGQGALVDRLDSDDRLEALIAAVLAGYVAGQG